MSTATPKWSLMRYIIKPTADGYLSLHPYCNDDTGLMETFYTGFKVNEGDTFDVFTTNPAQSYENAYPIYSGTYSDTVVLGSDLPNKYKWTVMRGNEGKDGEDGTSSYTYQAYSWSSDGKDRFSIEYPKENLVRNYDFREKSLKWHNANGLEATIDEDIMTITKPTTTTSRSFTYQMLEQIPVVAGATYQNTVDVWIDPNIINIHGTTIFARTSGNPLDLCTIVLSGNLERGKWITLNAQSKGANTIKNLFQYVVAMANKTVGTIKFRQPKFELSDTPTLRTPSMKDSYDEANPPYLGILTTSKQTQSVDPAQYSWSLIRGQDGQTTFMWIRYADDAQGTGISSSPNGKAYMAVKHVVNNANASDNTKDYEGLWTKILGDPGKDSQQGPKGDRGPRGPMGMAYYQPTSPSGIIESGATWFKTKSITDLTVIEISTYTNGKWEPNPISNTALQVESLAALSADLGNVKAGTLEGVRLVNTYKDVPNDGTLLTGTTTIAESSVRIEGKTSSKQAYITQMNPKGMHSTIYFDENRNKILTSFSLGSYGMDFYDSFYGPGSLSARYLVDYPWWKLSLGAGYSYYKTNKEEYRQEQN